MVVDGTQVVGYGSGGCVHRYTSETAWRQSRLVIAKSSSAADSNSASVIQYCTN